MTAAPNGLFREHVTGTAFALTLGKTHITALVKIDLELKYGKKLRHTDTRLISRSHQLDVQAATGLIARGLLVHVWPEHEAKYKAPDACGRMVTRDFDAWLNSPPAEHWRITRAGRLVCELLAEAGIYQEYAAPLLPLLEAATGKKITA